jgi:hypothetical protein
MICPCSTSAWYTGGSGGHGLHVGFETNQMGQHRATDKTAFPCPEFIGTRSGRASLRRQEQPLHVRLVSRIHRESTGHGDSVVGGQWWRRAGEGGPILQQEGLAVDVDKPRRRGWGRRNCRRMDSLKSGGPSRSLGGSRSRRRRILNRASRAMTVTREESLRPCEIYLLKQSRGSVGFSDGLGSEIQPGVQDVDDQEPTTYELPQACGEHRNKSNYGRKK